MSTRPMMEMLRVILHVTHVAYTLAAVTTIWPAVAHAPTWVTTKGKTVNLTLIAAYTNALSGFNFNGAGDGKMTVTVPFGDKVNVTFTNKGVLPRPCLAGRPLAMLKSMDTQLSNVPPPQEPDHPEPLPPVRGHGFVLERLLSVNGLISLVLLTWGAAVLRRPSLARNTWRALCRRFPWFVGGTPGT